MLRAWTTAHRAVRILLEYTPLNVPSFLKHPICYKHIRNTPQTPRTGLVKDHLTLQPSLLRFVADLSKHPKFH